VIVKLVQSGWAGGISIGRVQVPLVEVVEKGRMKKQYEVDGGRGSLELEVDWKGYFD
jgi:hypothetical protein